MTLHVNPAALVHAVLTARASFIHVASQTTAATPQARQAQLIGQAIDLLQPVSLAKLAGELGTTVTCLHDLRCADGRYIQPGCNALMVLETLSRKVAQLPVPQVVPAAAPLVVHRVDTYTLPLAA